MSQVVLVTGASSGFGNLIARTLARGGHTVYASMRDTAGRNAPRVAEVRAWAEESGVDLRTVELDVLSQVSADAAVRQIVNECGRLDVVVHNAGHLTVGPTEAFSTEEIAGLFDTNVLGTHRVNRAALPVMRDQGQGLLLWISSTTVFGGYPPFMGAYAATKAAVEGLLRTLAMEVSRFGIETATVVPGAFTAGTEHFPHASHPADSSLAGTYDQRYDGLDAQVGRRLAELTPADAPTAQAVADAVAEVVATPHGQRPFRTLVDPVGDGAAEVLEVTERVRIDFAKRLGIDDLWHPSTG